MTSKQPLVSVIVPTYNREKLVGTCIESILAQTYPNVEAVVVNDGSTDGSLAVMRRYEEKYPGRVVVVDKPNGGISSALNAGARAMRGEYFCWLSSDDYFAPEKVEAELKIFAEHPDTGMVHTDWWEVDEDGRILRELRTRQSEPNRLAWTLFVINTVNGSSVMIPRRVLDDVGLFDETLDHSQDYDMWLKIARKYPVRHIAQPLLYYRIHSGQLSNIPGKNIECEVVSFKRALALWSLSDWMGEDASRLTDVELADRLSDMGLMLLSRFGDGPGGLPQDAIRYFDAAIKVVQDKTVTLKAVRGKAEALNRLGVRLAKAGKLGEAREKLQESYLLAPKADTLANLAWILTEQGEADKAYGLCLAAVNYGVTGDPVSAQLARAQAKLIRTSGACRFELIWDVQRPEVWQSVIKAYVEAFAADEPVSLQVAIPDEDAADRVFEALGGYLSGIDVDPETIPDVEITAVPDAAPSAKVDEGWDAKRLRQFYRSYRQAGLGISLDL